jgi:hypothetical protein
VDPGVEFALCANSIKRIANPLYGFTLAPVILFLIRLRANYPLFPEPVPKFFPCFETGPFLTKCKKTGENCDFFRAD